MTREWQIFVPGVGQHDNIGDIILRRELIQWLRPLGRLHVYVGDAPDGYAEALGAGDDAIIYYGFGKWYRTLVREALRRRSAYVFKPGEIQLTFVGMKEHLGMLPALALTRLAGGPTARVGVGTRNFAPLPRLLMQPSILLSRITAWRDTGTASYMQGRLMPDLAFGQGDRSLDGRLTAAGRRHLVVSMRSDRDAPSDEWISAVARTAEENDLEVVTVVQVLRDRERSALLAQRLGGRLHDWNGVDPLGHEDELRKLYKETRLVVSDRLHVLIAATTEGAAPAALLTDRSDKIARHFSAAGIDGVALAEADASSDELIAHLQRRLNQLPETCAAVRRARVELHSIREEVESLFRPELDPFQRVHHVGRAGEVAGGMSQVVNSYLEWTFAHSNSDLIRSRDGSRGARAALLFLGAVTHLLRTKPSTRDVVVVHLSQRGSFIREGLLLRLARARGFATVAHIHGSEFVAYSAAHAKQVGAVLRRAHVIIALSDATRDAVQRLVSSADVRIVPNAVAAALSAPKGKVVVFGGAVSARKGVGPLLEAWSRIYTERSDWTLKVIGPVKDPALLRPDVPGVEFPGSLAHDALLGELAHAQIAVLPSYDEAMPVFLIEAMAHRCAVVSTAVGGIPELLRDGAGLVIAPGDVDALAEALSALIDDEELRAATSSSGHARFRSSFSMDAVGPTLEKTWAAAREHRWAPVNGALSDSNTSLERTQS